MNDTQESSLLWWVIPGVLAGMPMPFLHPDRRMNRGGNLTKYDDDLTLLHRAGIRAVVSLLGISVDSFVYESAGFSFLDLPVPDGCAPTIDQASIFVRFVREQRSNNRPVAVHCEAGIGRTGTLIAVYLISEGESAVSAVQRIRAVEKSAVETTQQVGFLELYAAALRADQK